MVLKVGMIGCGGIAERRHIPGLLERPDAVEIVAMADVDGGRLNVLAAQVGVTADHCYLDYNSLLEREKLDLLVVATPLAYHEAVVMAAAGRVPIVLVEKPLSSEVRAGARMVEECEREGTQLGVVHNQLFRPTVEAAVAMLRSGELGKPFLYRDELLGASHRVGSGTDPDWRTQRSMAAGGSLMDNSYHTIYLAEEFMGSPVASVQAQVGTFTHDYDVEDTALVLLRHAGGQLSSLQSGWGITSGRYSAQRVYEVHASEGSILFSREGDRVSVARPGVAEPEALQVAEERLDDAGYYVFRDRFLDSVLTGAPLPTTGGDSLHVLAVVEAAYASTQGGNAVAVTA
jgi:predicted dehydrogenase